MTARTNDLSSQGRLAETFAAASATSILAGASTAPKEGRTEARLEGGEASLHRTGFAPSSASVEREELRFLPRPATLRALRLGLFDLLSK